MQRFLLIYDVNGVSKVCRLEINGGKCLCGEIRVQGSKNSVLPILAATLLTDKECVIHNCPKISDTISAFKILCGLGCRTQFSDGTAVICASDVNNCMIPSELMKKMRSSVMFLGPILATKKEAVICRPGGCRLGERPIDIHINAFKKLGAEIYEDGECITCQIDKVLSNDITLLYPSVGATENIMLLCAGSNVEVKIINSAREPEIVDLQNFLNKMGADIRGAGTDVIRICPRCTLHGCDYKVMTDRIVAATYGCAVAMCGGDVFLKEAEPEHLRVFIAVLEEMGCGVFVEENGIRVSSDKRILCMPSLKTLPYPGFPTDVQPVLTAALTVADGCSKINETIFENRFGFTDELLKMGADIQKDGCSVLIQGVDKLHGAEVTAADLRGGAALVSAGLAADEKTIVNGIEFLDRGYENIEAVLSGVGADIRRA